MEEKKVLTVVGTREVLSKDFNFYGTWEQPMFLAKEVADRIEHSNVRMMLQPVDDDEKVVRIAYTLGGNQKQWFLTEQGLYEVCMLSRKPIAKEMKKEIKTILKEVRLNGGSVKIGMEEDFVKAYFPDFSEETKLSMVNDLKTQNEKLKSQLNQVKPMLEEYNTFMNNDNKEVSMNIVSKEIEVLGRNKLFEFLRNKKVFMSKHERWNVPYQQYIKQGYFTVKEKINPDGESRPQTFVTPRGYSFIIKKLKESGYLSDVSKDDLVSQFTLLTEGGIANATN